MGLYKLREWVCTVTGKGDRWEGDRQGRSEPALQVPAPPHSLHQPALHGERPANFVCWLLCFFKACAGRIVRRLCSPAAALFCRLCLPAATFAMPCPLPSSFLPRSFCFAHPPCSFPCAPGSSKSCKDCPVGSYNTGLQWRPVRRFLTIALFPAESIDPGPWFSVKFVS